MAPASSASGRERDYEDRGRHDDDRRQEDRRPYDDDDRRPDKKRKKRSFLQDLFEFE
jgi:hypothetical protein